MRPATLPQKNVWSAVMLKLSRSAVMAQILTAAECRTAIATHLGRVTVVDIHGGCLVTEGRLAHLLQRAALVLHGKDANQRDVLLVSFKRSIRVKGPAQRAL